MHEKLEGRENKAGTEHRNYISVGPRKGTQIGGVYKSRAEAKAAAKRHSKKSDEPTKPKR
jgi:hypothetical protein